MPYPERGLRLDRMASHDVRLTLDLRIDGDEVDGSATDSAGEIRNFVGWLGMLGTIDALTSAESRTEAHDVHC